MSDERTAADAPRHATEPENQALARLFEEAGRRDDVPAEHLAAIKTAFRAEWTAQVGANRARRRAARGIRSLPAAAAVLAIAVLGGWWLVSHSVPAARVEAVTGVALLEDPGADPDAARIALSIGQVAAPGAAIETGPTGDAAGAIALRLASGASLRLDAGTSVRLVTPNLIELERGRLYVDSGPGGRGAVTVRTPLGTATENGTQFEVRLLPGAESPRALRLRVREGRVALEFAGGLAETGAESGTSESRAHQVDAGTELVLHPDGTVERHVIASWGDDWRWILAVAPPFVTSEATVKEFLDWVARETGWTIRFEDEELAARAASIEIRGTLSSIPPDSARLILRSAGLDSELTDGVLLVHRPDPGTVP